MKVTDPNDLALILGYCKAQQRPCWVIRTPPESTIGGFSCELLRIEGDHAMVRIANGDKMIVPIDTISVTIASS